MVDGILHQADFLFSISPILTQPPAQSATAFRPKSAMGTQLTYVLILKNISASFRDLLLSALSIRQLSGLTAQKKHLEIPPFRGFKGRCSRLRRDRRRILSVRHPVLLRSLIRPTILVYRAWARMSMKKVSLATGVGAVAACSPPSDDGRHGPAGRDRGYPLLAIWPARHSGRPLLILFDNLEKVVEFSRQRRIPAQ